MIDGYILPDDIRTMDDYRKWMTRNPAPDPDTRELKKMQLRRYEVITQHFEKIVDHIKNGGECSVEYYPLDRKERF